MTNGVLEARVEDLGLIDPDLSLTSLANRPLLLQSLHLKLGAPGDRLEVVGAVRDAQNAAQHSHRRVRRLRVDELVDGYSSSFAKKTAAFS